MRLERRSEIGLRRALGTTRGQIRTQFLAEAIPARARRRRVGIAAGALATAIYATTKNETVVIPPHTGSGRLSCRNEATPAERTGRVRKV
jgi:putative ABC transport system permease protein